MPRSTGRSFARSFADRDQWPGATGQFRVATDSTIFGSPQSSDSAFLQMLTRTRTSCRPSRVVLLAMLASILLGGAGSRFVVSAQSARTAGGEQNIGTVRMDISCSAAAKGPFLLQGSACKRGCEPA